MVTDPGDLCCFNLVHYIWRLSFWVDLDSFASMGRYFDFVLDILSRQGAKKVLPILAGIYLPGERCLTFG